MADEFVVDVVRSGGFAGLVNRWSASIREQDAPEWAAMVDACPWGSVAQDSAARDRFSYAIEVRMPRRRRRATVPERSMTGPWRNLVDAVQRYEPAPSGPSAARPTRIQQR